jgi:hypothetical protein
MKKQRVVLMLTLGLAFSMIASVFIPAVAADLTIKFNSENISDEVDIDPQHPEHYKILHEVHEEPTHEHPSHPEHLEHDEILHEVHEEPTHEHPSHPEHPVHDHSTHDHYEESTHERHSHPFLSIIELFPLLKEVIELINNFFGFYS